MSVETWEEFVQYDWSEGDMRVSVEIEGNILYYILPNGLRGRWFNIVGINPSVITNSWTPIETSRTHLLTSQEERVCRKIKMMEERWERFQENKKKPKSEVRGKTFHTVILDDAFFYNTL